MNIVMAKTFLEIVETRNFNKAASHLNVTQSTITMRINALEDLLGQKLFTRSKTGSELTPAGVKFQRYAERLIQVWQQALQEIALPDDIVGALNIGGDVHLWNGVVGEWISWLRRDLPSVALSLWAGDSRTMLRWLTEGLVDVVLAYDPLSQGDLQTEKLFDEELVLVATEPQKLTRKWPSGYIYIDWDDAFRNAHSLVFPIESAPHMTFSHGEWALQYILDNGGSGYFPLRQVNRYIQEKKLFVIQTSHQFTRSSYLIYPNSMKKTDWFVEAIDTLHAIVDCQFKESGINSE